MMIRGYKPCNRITIRTLELHHTLMVQVLENMQNRAIK